jgi:1,4-dihydroxy-2-naphthoate octaprenyltransferase
MRDQIEDKQHHKNTLVVKLGSQKAKIYHYLLIIGAFISAVFYVQLKYHSPMQYLFLIAFFPLFLNIKVVAQNIIFSELDSELKKVALSTFLFAILFAIGQIF